MKKLNSKNKTLTTTIVVLLAAYLLVRAFNIIAYYTLPSNSMEPNYKEGKTIIVSSLFQPKIKDVVCYKSESIAVEGFREAQKGEFVGRIVGTGNDILEIKDGYVFINDLPIDDDIPLKFSYFIGPKEKASNEAFIKKLSLPDYFTVGDSMIIFLDDEQIQDFVGGAILKKMDPPLRNIELMPAKEFIKAGWTINNYGPIKIPEHRYFILGDSRNNSEDSRMRGFVHKDKIIGVVLN